MSSFKLFWTLHRWTGIIAAAFFACTATTGFLLLMKKKVDWIQPPMMIGAAGGVSEFITNQQLFESVFAQEHPDFQSIEDIDRVDFRPNDRVFKVRSEHNWSEIQVDAVTGEVLSSRKVRRSDLIEQIHDGSFWADWVHEWVMPVISFALLFMVFSGLWLWIEPSVRKRRRKKRQATKRIDSMSTS